MFTIFFGYGFRNYLTSIITFLLLILIHIESSAEYTILFLIYTLFLLPISIILHFTLYIHFTNYSFFKYYATKSVSNITRKLLLLAILPSVILFFLVSYLNQWDLHVNFRILLINTVISAQFGVYQFISLYKKVNHGYR
jgi:hypothetical protein